MTSEKTSNHSRLTRKLNGEGNDYPLAVPMVNIVIIKIHFLNSKKFK